MRNPNVLPTPHLAYSRYASPLADLTLKSARLSDISPLLLVLSLGQPELLEGAEGAQDGPADPHAKPSLDRGSGQGPDLFCGYCGE